MSEQQLADTLIADARSTLAKGMHKIEHCVGQLSDEQVWWRPRSEMNSIANLLLHLSGNVRQWMVSGIGGAKDIRDRPLEFSDHSNRPKTEVLAQLQATVKEADAALAKVSAADLTTPRRIQGFDTNAIAAILKCLSHFHGHVQEIIHMTRAQLGEHYKFDFVPKGPEQTSAKAPAGSH